MAALGAQTIASSYEQLLHVDTDGGGNSTTHVSVKDGDNGTTFGFTIASDALMMTSTNRLEFGDNATYIHQSSDSVLSVVSDGDIVLTPGAAGSVYSSGDGGTANTIFGNDAGDALASGGDYNTFYGSQSGSALTTGDNNVAIGRNALATHVDGSYNIAIGVGAMGNTDADTTVDGSLGNVMVGEGAGGGAWATAVSNYNVGIGYQSMFGACNGALDNVAIGKDSLKTLTTGDDNVVVGSGAGDAVTDEEGLVLIGRNAGGGASIDNGANGLTAVGYEAGAAVTSSSNTTLIGYAAGDAITSGDSNTAVGRHALGVVSTGSFNTAVGHDTLNGAAVITGSKNTSLGYQAGESIQGAGAQNTCVGAYAGEDITTGSRNVIIGHEAEPSSATAVNEIVIGDSAQGQGNNRAIYGHTDITHHTFQSGFVGISHTDPKKMLHIRRNDTDCMIVLDSQDSIADKQICFAEDYGSGSTSDGQYWSVGVDASEGPDFVIAYDTNSQPSMGGDDDRLRIYNTGATKISNSAVNTTASFSGIESNFVKTLGASATDDIFRGIKSTMNFNDGDASLQWLIGGEFDATCTATATAANNATYALKATSSMNGGNVDNNIAINGSNQHDGGTTDFDQIGLNLTMGCDGGTVGRDMYGAYIGINTGTNPAGFVKGMWINIQGAGVDATNDKFFTCYDDQNDDVVAQITALAGVATFDSGDFSGAPDYAEYFESKDGKAITIGKTVKLDGDKIVACEDGDTPIGVVRPKASSAVVANAKRLGYQGKYLKSEYDEIIMEDYTIKKWKESINEEAYLKGLENTAKESENYVMVEGVSGNADSFYRKHEYHSDRIPDGITVPNDAENLTPNHKRKKLNPDFNPSLVDGYKSRAERDEWCLIGLLGQIPITKGQPLASNWIKMKDVSDTVEMYFVK